MISPAMIGRNCLKMDELESLQPGNGAIISINNRDLAVYRREDGSLITLSPICTHQACTVEWSGGEGKTWNCPCHGSSFSAEGKVLNGPAEKDLPVEKI